MEFEPLELEVTLFKTRIQEFIAIFDGKIDIPPSETVQGELVCFADGVFLSLEYYRQQSQLPGTSMLHNKFPSP